jgi:hypothetical protein
MVHARTCWPGSFISCFTTVSNTAALARVMPDSPPTSAKVTLADAVCISTFIETFCTSVVASLLRHKQLEKVSPRWTAPNEEGRARSGEACVRSRRVVGWPLSGAGPWRISIEATARACNDGTPVKNGSQVDANDGR